MLPVTANYVRSLGIQIVAVGVGQANINELRVSVMDYDVYKYANKANTVI